MRELRGSIGWFCVAVAFATCARSAHAQSDADAPAEPADPGAPAGPAAPAGSAPNQTQAPISHISEFLYVNAAFGVQYVGLETLHLTKELFPSQVHNADIGGAASFGAGVRLLFVTLGPRFQFGHFRDWDLWTLDAEVGFKIPLGALEPYILFAGGYAKVGSLRNSRVRIQGYNIRLGFGADYYLNKAFSIGGSATADLLGLTRPGVDLNQGTGSVSEDIYKLDGSSVGAALMASAVVGFHL
ncbi:MAG TPA: hypothetical protein VK540_06555 [Polyangiaceae bacterium]|nr:hypothetical protein [Polyangiaceae bacterium]